MHTVTRIVPVLFSALLVLPGLSCKKAEEPPAPAVEEAMESAADADTSAVMRKAKAGPAGGAADGPAAEEMKADDGRGLRGHFLAPMDLAKERLLEYRVELTFKTKNILASRRELLGIVAKYGYVSKSSAALDEDNAAVSADLFVKSEKLYEALLDMDRIGTLLAESITVTDHTDNMELQNRKARREQLRIARKGIASGQIGAGARNWSDVETSLSQSEDELDAAEHEKWQIRDRVAWANVHVVLNGPEQPGRVKVPKYVNAFIGLVNALLILLYGLIYLVPFAAIAAVIVWKRERIIGIFRRKKE